MSFLKFADFLAMYGDESEAAFWRQPSVSAKLRRLDERSATFGQISADIGVTPEMIGFYFHAHKEEIYMDANNNDDDEIFTKIPTLKTFLKLHPKGKRGSQKKFWAQKHVQEKIEAVFRGHMTRSKAAKVLGVKYSQINYRVKLKDQKRQVEKKEVVEIVHEPKEEDLEGESLYEVIRKRNIEEKASLFQQLGLDTMKKKKAHVKKAQKKKKVVHFPTRPKSVRIKRAKRPSSLFSRPKISANGDVAANVVQYEDEVEQEEEVEEECPVVVPAVASLKLDQVLCLGQDYGECGLILDEISESLEDFNVVDLMRRPLNDADSLEVVSVLKLNQHSITSVDMLTLDSGGFLIASADVSGELGLWKGHNKTVAIKPHYQQINCVTFNPFNPPQVITSSNDGLVRSLDLTQQSLEVVYQWDKHKRQTGSDSAIHWHEVVSATSLLVGHSDIISRFDARNSRRYNFFGRTNGRKIAYHPLNEHVYAVPTCDKSVCIMDDRRLGLVQTEIRLPSEPMRVEFSPVDGSKLLVTSMMESGPKMGKSPMGLVQVVDWEASFLDPVTQWSAHLDQSGNGAIWHPDKKAVLFVNTTDPALMRYAKKRPVGNFANIMAVDCDNDRLLNHFSHNFTEKTVGMVAQPDTPFMVVYNGRGQGTVCLLAHQEFTF